MFVANERKISLARYRIWGVFSLIFVFSLLGPKESHAAGLFKRIKQAVVGRKAPAPKNEYRIKTYTLHEQKFRAKRNQSETVRTWVDTLNTRFERPADVRLFMGVHETLRLSSEQVGLVHFYLTSSGTVEIEYNVGEFTQNTKQLEKPRENPNYEKALDEVIAAQIAHFKEVDHTDIAQSLFFETDNNKILPPVSLRKPGLLKRTVEKTKGKVTAWSEKTRLARERNAQQKLISSFLKDPEEKVAFANATNAIKEDLAKKGEAETLIAMTNLQGGFLSSQGLVRREDGRWLALEKGDNLYLELQASGVFTFRLSKIKPFSKGEHKGESVVNLPLHKANLKLIDKHTKTTVAEYLSLRTRGRAEYL